jgi:hypothetical protein
LNCRASDAAVLAECVQWILISAGASALNVEAPAKVVKVRAVAEKIQRKSISLSDPMVADIPALYQIGR